MVSVGGTGDLTREAGGGGGGSTGNGCGGGAAMGAEVMVVDDVMPFVAVEVVDSATPVAVTLSVVLPTADGGPGRPARRLHSAMSFSVITPPGALAARSASSDCLTTGKNDSALAFSTCSSSPFFERSDSTALGAVAAAAAAGAGVIAESVLPLARALLSSAIARSTSVASDDRLPLSLAACRWAS